VLKALEGSSVIFLTNCKRITDEGVKAISSICIISVMGYDNVSQQCQNLLRTKGVLLA